MAPLSESSRWEPAGSSIRRMCPALAILVVAVFVSRPANGLIDLDRVKSWLIAENRRANEPLDSILSGREFDYLVRWGPGATRHELDALESEVAGKPDHPQRVRLARVKDELANGPEQTLSRVWWFGPTRWRHSQEPVRIQDEALAPIGRRFTDTAFDGTSAWSLIPEQANIVDAAAAPPGYDYASDGFSITLNIKRLLFAGLQLDGKPTSVSAPEELPDGRWRAALTSQSGLSIVFEGVIDSERGPAVVVSSLAHWPEQPGASDRWAFGSRKELPGLPVPVYETAAELENGSERLILRPVSCAPSALSASEVTAPPSLDRADPVRGMVKVASLNDFRTGRSLQISAQEDSEQPRVTETRLVQTRSPGIRLLGWGLLTALCFAFLYVRFKRSS